MRKGCDGEKKSGGRKERIVKIAVHYRQASQHRQLVPKNWFGEDMFKFIQLLLQLKSLVNVRYFVPPSCELISCTVQIFSD